MVGFTLELQGRLTSDLALYGSVNFVYVKPGLKSKTKL